MEIAQSPIYQFKTFLPVVGLHYKDKK